MASPADRGAGACEGMTGHLPGKLLCCCNCNCCNYDCCKCAPQLCTEPAHKLSIRRTYDVVLLRSFTLACPALLDSTWLPPASCLGLSMPHLSILATRCVHSFFATHTLFIVVREWELLISQVLSFFERSVLSGT